MPRKYDRVIRYYASWFDDILDPAKEFTDAEFKQVILAIRDVQVQGKIDPLLALPISIRRALSMATLGEQIMRLLERSERMRARGSAGGRAAAAAQAVPEQKAAAAIGDQLRALERQRKDEERTEWKQKAVSKESYGDMLVKAAKGDKDMLELLRISQAEALDLAASFKKGGKA